MLQTYTFSQIVSNMATTIQGQAAALLNFTTGSVLRAIAQATASVTLWLQAIVLQVLTLTRAATSTGSDLDSWMADFGVTRLPATPATGSVGFSRFNGTQQALIPVGASLQTSDATQKFTVVTDTTNSAYSASLKGYVIPANVGSLSVPVQAVTPGTAGNILSGTLTVITSPIPFVDTVTNGAPFTNGIDAETDDALRIRFVAYLNSLSKATSAAIANAIHSVRQGLNYTITQNAAYGGAFQPGYFYVVLDDGTGFPSSDLIDSVSSAINAVRGLTINFNVFAPVTETANVTMALTSASGFNHAAVVAAVTAALQNFIAALTLGTPLPYTQLASIAYDVPGVANATGILLNGATSDLAATNQQKVLPGTMTIS